MISAASQPPYADDVGRDLALDAEADGDVGTDPDGEREDEQEQLRTPASPVHESHEGSGLRHQPLVESVVVSAWRSARFSTVLRALGEAAAVDALADLVGVEVGEPVELDVRRLVGRRQVDAGRSALRPR